MKVMPVSRLDRHVDTYQKNIVKREMMQRRACEHAALYVPVGECLVYDKHGKVREIGHGRSILFRG